MNARPAAGENRAVEVCVMFSGGRDSTLAAALTFETRAPCVLVSCNSGLGYDTYLRNARVRELQRVYPDVYHEALTLTTRGLVRSLVLVTLVEDIQTDGYQCVLLGEALAALGACINLCRRRGTRRLVFGAVGYQSAFPEQQPGVLAVLRSFTADFGVTLELPVLQQASEASVKDALRERELSTKSLEAATMFADLKEPPADIALRYAQRKLPLLREHLVRYTPITMADPGAA